MSKKEELKPDYSLIEQAHSYMLDNCEEVQVYTKEHYEVISEEYQHLSQNIDDIHRKIFPN